MQQSQDTFVVTTCDQGHTLEANLSVAGCVLPCPRCAGHVAIPDVAQSPSAGGLLRKILMRMGFLLMRGILLAVVLLGIFWLLFIRKGEDQLALEQLEYIGEAFQAFESKHKAFAFQRSDAIPDLSQYGPATFTELSWRVHLLPYLGHEELYRRFHLDEPWDSEHNLALLDYIPDCYQFGASGNTTRFRVLSGPNFLFGQSDAPTAGAVADGPGSTLLVLYVGSDKAVPWTKPDELQIDSTDPVGSLGRLGTRYIPTITVDGRSLMLPSDISAEKFLAFATPAEGELVNARAYRDAYQNSIWNLVPNLKKTYGLDKIPLLD